MAAAMARITINRTQRRQKKLDTEIAQLRDLSTNELRARWRTVFRREAPHHLSGHLQFRILAYRLQTDALGDLEDGNKRLLEEARSATTRQNQKFKPTPVAVQQGTILAREWKGRMHRVAVLANGFAWNGKTYPSLSKIAFEITRTRWNGPRFFGLRDKPAPQSGKKP